MRLRRALPFALVAALALGACGAAEVAAPRLALKRAAAELGDDRRMNFTVSFAGEEQDAVAFFSEGEQAVTPDDQQSMKRLFNSRFSVAVDQGPEKESAEDDSLALAIEVDDLERAVEFRQIEGVLYARAAVRDLVGMFADPAAVDVLLAQGRALDLDFLPGAVDGGWLALDLAPLESLAKGMAGSGGEEPGGVGPAGLDAGLFKGLLDAVSGAYGADVNVTRLGDDDTGDHYRLVASARKLYERLLPALRDLPMLEGIADGELPTASDVPDTKYELDVWVQDGRIARTEFDLTQFSQAATRPGPVKLRVDINRRPDGISVPADAERIDVMELWGRMLGAPGAMAGGGFPGLEGEAPVPG